MFRFTIRDLLWLTVVSAVGAGWGIEHFLQVPVREEGRRFDELVSALNQHGIQVDYSKGTWWVYHQ